jgi:hypothetical protein
MVFVLLGAPTHAGQKPMQTGDDQADPAALFRYTPGQVKEAGISSGGKSIMGRSQQLARQDAVSGPGTSSPSASSNWRETWRYSRKELPAGLPYSWVDFVFITKPGYGDGVLQKDPSALQALDRAKSSMRKTN